MSAAEGRMPKARWILLIEVALLVLVASTLQANQTTDLDRLNGRWKLDWGRSDSFEPAMLALEVPWLFRRLAGIASAHVLFTVEPPECEECDPRLRIVQETPIKNTTRVVILDGVPRPFEDVLGNDCLDRFTWDSEHGVEMMRERALKSGRSARIRERRTVEDDMKTMVAEMTVWIDGEERASIRRVLRKLEK
jgi:hypothetical protein